MISLNMLVKDEVDNVLKLVHNAEPYVDGIFLTVSDPKAYEELKNLNNKQIKVDFRKWSNRFDEARQHNWDLAKDYTYSMWIDADDSFDFSKVPKLLRYMDEYDAVFLPYHYEHDENGNVIVYHWRERIVKREKGFYWKGWVHENLISEQPFKNINVDVPVIHQQRENHKETSGERNHKILLEAYNETNDPRYIHYLGVSYFTLKDFENAIKVLKEYLEVGGWDEEIYRSLIKISESYYMLNQHMPAVDYILKAIALMPEYPMAYYLLAHYEFDQENYKEALEWIKVGIAKPVPKNASIYDPTSKDRAILQGGLCEAALGNYREAVELLKRVQTVEISEVLQNYEREASISRLHDILPALFKHYNEPKVLWESLEEDIKYRPEFRKYREQFTEPKKWDKGSIVFFCGKGFEEWGPHTLDKGMGGSEEAIVYLSKELAKIGYDVTVYGGTETPLEEPVFNVKGANKVKWLPWQYIDRRDEFDTLVVWRYPQFATQFKANKILIDMHDLLGQDAVKNYDNVHYLFKSEWHKDRYDVGGTVIPNGIVASQFKTMAKKPKVIYPSAYYRGAECLLGMWKRIKEQVPQATLDIYYGWESWVAGEGEDDFYHRMKKKFKEMEKYGVKEHGRISHTELADKMARAKVWAYPTEFPEIFCITAVKANLAGCKPVITDVAALKETGGPSADFIETNKIYSDEYSQEKFINKVVKALKEQHDPKVQKEWAKKYDWQNIAKQWKEVIDA